MLVIDNGLMGFLGAWFDRIGVVSGAVLSGPIGVVSGGIMD